MITVEGSSSLSEADYFALTTRVGKQGTGTFTAQNFGDIGIADLIIGEESGAIGVVQPLAMLRVSGF